MKTFMMMLSLGIFALFLGCQNLNSAPTPIPNQNLVAAKSDTHEGEEDNIRRISLEDAKKLYDEGKAYIVDARSKDAYQTERIKGSVNIPVGEIAQKIDQFPKDKTIIVYCS